MAEGVLSGSDGFTRANSNQNPPALSTWFDRFTDDYSEGALQIADCPSDDELLDSGQLDLDLTLGLSPTTETPLPENEIMSDSEAGNTDFLTQQAPLLSGANGRLSDGVPGVRVISNHGELASQSAGLYDLSAAITTHDDSSSRERASGGRSSRAPTQRPHCHMGGPEAADKLARNQLITVVVLCLLFMAGEAIGGALANSLALFTDVLHLGSDLISFIISLFAIYLSRKPASKHMSFGYHRAEVLGALFSVFIIWLISGILCYIAIERIIKKHYIDVKADEMLITATIGVVFNLVMAFVLHSERCCKFGSAHRSFGHNHSHGDGSHDAKRHRNDYQPLQQVLDDSVDTECHEHNHRHKNINVRAAFIHVLGDIIQSVGVLIAALIIKFTTEDQYKLADPICTFLFSLLVLITTIAVLRDTLRVMMEGVPRDVSYESVKRDLSGVEGVQMVHSLHLWSLTIDRNSLSVHLAVDEGVNYDDVLSTATSMLRRNHNVKHVTIQVESYDHDVMTSCGECQEPTL